MPDSDWMDDDWRPLLLAIDAKQCTPFLGAGACAGVLPLGGEIARDWAAQCDYPFHDTGNLPRVAQYRAVRDGSNTPKFEVQRLFRRAGRPDFSDENEPHRLMADLMLPLYVTTNYDDFMIQAILDANSRAESGHDRTPEQRVCPWYLGGQTLRRRTRPDEQEHDPTEESPLVFHLHGRIDRHETMVLTEDDYLDFLMYSSEPELALIPASVEEALVSSNLLFLGYALSDMNFKVIFRKLATYMRRAEGARHVSVQLAPTEDQEGQVTPDMARRQLEYLEEHFKLQRVKVYWGTCHEFARELRRRWTEWKGSEPA